MDDNLELWRQFQRDSMNARTVALQDQQAMLRSIRTYVAISFWLFVIGSVILGIDLATADPVPVYYP